MNKTCARCEKTVYPTEELKCLDKVWHKGCFKCQECGMTLNMRTYKGYGKLPYCEAHVPKAKHTTMAETPELKRIAENTKLQSNVKYHADFEKSKGKFTQVADDPETLRIKANTKIISNVAYHGDLEKKAQMEKQRQINENGEIVDVATNDNYHQQIETYATEMLPPPNLPPKNHYQIPVAQTHRQYQEPRQEEYYPHPQYEDYPANANQPQGQGFGNQKIGRIQDYDPLSDGPRAPPNTQRASATLIYSSDGKRGAHQVQQANRHIGRVTDMDPLASEQPRPHNHSVPHHHTQHSQVNQHQVNQHSQINQHTQHSQMHQHSQMNQHSQHNQANQHNQVNQRVYIAMYDYEANDSDEVSFREGDYISNVTSIDEGWMTGRVVRTGRTGMLPANYVELVDPRAFN